MVEQSRPVFGRQVPRKPRLVGGVKGHNSNEDFLSGKSRPVGGELHIHDPFAAVSCGNSLHFKTGTQRSERPVFINKAAPCRQACPIGINIPLAFHHASRGDLDQALRIYLQDNPLPGVCGRVCYHPCERECHRGEFDEPINIRSLERFLSDHGRADGSSESSVPPRKEKIAVVGSGPAGLSASYHLSRLGYHVTLIEARSGLGGMLRYGIPEYRLPRSTLDKEIARITALGIKTHVGTWLGRDIVLSDLESFDAVFLSPGLPLGKMLRVLEGEEGAVITGLEFLASPRKWHLGQPSQKIVVVGGGNVAFDVSRTLVRLRRGRSKNITLICPESRKQMPALSEEIEEALEEGITVLNGWAPSKFFKGNGKRRSLEFFKTKVTRDPGSAVFRISRLGKDTLRLEADKIILAVGQTVDISVLAPLGIRRERAAADRFGRTSLTRVFVGGDAAGSNAFVADAIASGKQGALSIASSLEGRNLEEEFEIRRIGKGPSFSLEPSVHGQGRDGLDLKRVVSYDEINTLFFDRVPRNNPGKGEPGLRKRTFREVTGGLSPLKMEQEASRCFKCGTCIECESCIDFCPDLSILKGDETSLFSFDADHCKGCGICMVACPRHVIEMVRETV
jgi:NADPH-dependent glutamate synthase beta subunit-like oxidoreductase